MGSTPVSAWESESPDRLLGDEDLHFLINLLMEREVPLTAAEMARALAEHWQAQPRAPAPAESSSVPAYRPAEHYPVGSVIRFPQVGHRSGKVVARRAAENPEMAAFDVMTIEFEDSAEKVDFASGLAEHKLNAEPVRPAASHAGETAEDVVARMAKQLEPSLQDALAGSPDLVRIAGRWFPKALLAEIHDGHRNLAEAVLDVASGGPLATRELLQHVELPPGMDPLLSEFSLDYALQEDERFDEVGPAGVVLWHLRRLEPPEVLLTPPRLQYEEHPYDRGQLTATDLALEAQLDDEHSPLPSPDPAEDEVTLTLLFPHWRVGALPLSSRLRPLFPTAYEAPRIRFILVDGHTGERFPGWVVRGPRYVFGLDAWYQRHQVPCGGLVRVRRGEAKGEVLVEAVDRRKRNEWIRTITVDEADRIGFAMTKMVVGAAYDERMIIGLPNATALDEAWLRGGQRRQTLDRLVPHVFRELAKLNPQSAVHAQALYSGLNVIRRSPPGPILAELERQAAFEHVGDLHWRLAEPAAARA